MPQTDRPVLLPDAAADATPSAPPGLRERRKAETTAQIHQAAVVIVERDGLEAATVARIAEAAGVSPRTFFRYFPSKEAAILPGQGELAEALELLGQSGPLKQPTAARAVGALTALLGDLIREDPIDHHEHRRIGALMEAEPALREHVSSKDSELIRKAAAVLLRLSPGLDLDEARLHAEIAFGAWRVAWWSWDRLGATPEYPTPYSRWLWATQQVTNSAGLLASGTPANG